MESFTVTQLIRRFERETKQHLDDIPSFLSSVRVQKIKERQFVLMEGEKCTSVYIVRSGLFKQFYTKLDGTHWISNFSPEGCLIGCTRAFLYGKKSTFSSISMESSVVEVFDWKEIEQKASVSVTWQALVRWLLQLQLNVKTERERELLMLNPEELYLKYQSDHPELLCRVPQKDLAGFLGVTAVGLNRIIKRSGDSYRSVQAADTYKKRRIGRAGWRSIATKAEE